MSFYPYTLQYASPKEYKDFSYITTTLLMPNKINNNYLVSSNTKPLQVTIGNGT